MNNTVLADVIIIIHMGLSDR